MIRQTESERILQRIRSARPPASSEKMLRDSAVREAVRSAQKNNEEQIRLMQMNQFFSQNGLK